MQQVSDLMALTMADAPSHQNRVFIGDLLSSGSSSDLVESVLRQGTFGAVAECMNIPDKKMPDLPSGQRERLRRAVPLLILNMPLGPRKASLSHPPMLLTVSKSLYTALSFSCFLPCSPLLLLLRSTMPATRTSTRAARTQETVRVAEEGCEVWRSAGLKLGCSVNSQLGPMKPLGHWHTGPVKWVKQVPPFWHGRAPQASERTLQFLPGAGAGVVVHTVLARASVLARGRGAVIHVHLAVGTGEARLTAAQDALAEVQAFPTCRTQRDQECYMSRSLHELVKRRCKSVRSESSHFGHQVSPLTVQTGPVAAAVQLLLAVGAGVAGGAAASVAAGRRLHTGAAVEARPVGARHGDDLAVLAVEALRAGVAVALVGLQLTVGASIAGPAGAGVAALARVGAGGSVGTGLVVGAIVEVLVAEEPPPALLAAALPRLAARPVEAARVADALLAGGALPAHAARVVAQRVIPRPAVLGTSVSEVVLVAEDVVGVAQLALLAEVHVLGPVFSDGKPPPSRQAAHKWKGTLMGALLEMEVWSALMTLVCPVPKVHGGSAEITSSGCFRQILKKMWQSRCLLQMRCAVWNELIFNSNTPEDKTCNGKKKRRK
ncbi:hypothetical protein EYF80_013126 [Liparis tanakae]|uniref:Uncharacterized protein n=1 Tax=Liparis tanakae TaxID=230148 RepID=A0A4Z2IGV2_9TELE|nr:hypothetical protein EYF80_013126 [Liparis tanakae]